jgi:nucleoside-diphosphate-sugar epimerase
MSSRKNRIALLGATGQIAKGLIYHLRGSEESELILFARSLERVQGFLAAIGLRQNVTPMEFSTFDTGSYDVIINCVGVGDPAKARGSGDTIFRLTEAFDNRVLDYIQQNNPDALYINLSSGAAYGGDFVQAADESTCAKFDINCMNGMDFYGIAKVNAEGKHRALKNHNIVDLRVFGYMSRFIDLKAEFFMSQVISCIREDRDFLTGPTNVIRDYVHPGDLASLVRRCIERKIINGAFDVYSTEPVDKFTVLEYFLEEYGLRYTVESGVSFPSVTGIKERYYSTNRKAETIGHVPEYSSMDCIALESKEILNEPYAETRAVSGA